MRSLLIFLAFLGLDPSSERAQQPDTVRLALRWEIAEGGAAVAESLGVLSGVAVDARGNVYVSDRGATKIWVFDSLGRSQRGIGRKGKGPGEFESPTGVAVGPDGMLWVRDMSRVTRFKVDPATQRLGAYASVFSGPLMADWMSHYGTRFGPQGVMYFPEFGVSYRVKPAPRRGRWFAYSSDGTLRDSLDVPVVPDEPTSYARVWVSANSGRMIHGLAYAPFTPIPVWDVTSRGTVLVGDAKSYLVRELDRGGRTVREYRRAVAPERIPAAERRDSTNALKARIDSLQYPKSQVEGVPPEVWALELPETYPPYMAVYGGIDGRVWVRRWVANGGARSVFDVFESDGRFRATVEVPRELAILPTPWLSLEQGVAGIGIDRETGANTVLRFGARR